ncbi:MAG TPA: wax ester/triacylglycerol synthase domain-containing protein [Ilumatobacteraceae bacterium]|nr:wax ester/triacylglycerol synthase domain-containing protein [Ilumatobacteraceae bacterium]
MNNCDPELEAAPRDAMLEMLMSRITYDDTMSSSDALIWHIEQDPQLRSTVMSVWFLEQPPSIERMRSTVERMVTQLPRLRQSVLDDRPRPRWVPAENFDVDDHYHYDDLGGSAEHADVLARAQQWVREPFDRSRPLWQLGIFSGLADGRGALVLKLHHAIADGVGLMLMLAAMADLEPNPRVRLALADVVTPPTPVERAPKHFSTFLRHPARSTRSAIRSGVSILKLVMPNRKPLSPMMVHRSSDLCLDTATLPFETLRRAGKQVGGSLNDAFIALVLDALDRYHDRYGTDCDKIRIHMPINIRDAATADRAGNQFVPARIVMTVGDDDAEGRLRRVSKHLAAVRQEPALRWVNSVSAAIQRLGVPISRRIIGGMMKGVDVLASNVAGPPCPLYLAGEHVEEFYAFGPPAGAALNITLFSYDKTVHLGVTTVAAAVESRRHFMGCLDEAIAEMTAVASKWKQPTQAASALAAA